MKYKNNNIAIIGDRIFTDILVGNRLGLYTILIKPLGPNGDELRVGGTATIIALYGGFSGFGLRTGFEYNMGTDLNLEGYGADAKLMSYYGNYNLTFIDGLSLIVRYDSLDNGADDDDQTDVDESVDTGTLLAGLSYKCAEGITFAPNMTQTTVGDDDPTTALNLTFMFKF